MLVSDFDFDLPERLIALRPVEPRDAARLLVVRPDAAFGDRVFRDLPQFLTPADVLVFNDTKVLPAFFPATRAPRAGHVLERPQPLFGPKVEVNLHKRVGPNTWLAFVKGAKKLEAGDRLTLAGALDALVAEKHEAGEVLLAFALEGDALDRAILAHGQTPLPPYIASRRKSDVRDVEDYQTVYARKEGSVAAPTAGLHFTPPLLDQIGTMGVTRIMLTLHVGAGTFLPVKSEDTSAHVMHSEWGEVTPAAAEALNAARRKGGRIIAVGTTSLRLLESAADEQGVLRPFAAETSIFITPGYRFRAVDALITNFHLPRSTLFMLVCALAGTEKMKSAYAHAIAAGYRFYSYGDASLLFRAG